MHDEPSDDKDFQSILEGLLKLTKLTDELSTHLEAE